MSNNDSVSNTNSSSELDQSGKLGCLGIVGILLLTVVVTIGATVWVIQSKLFAKEFEPVALDTSEQQTLQAKLDIFADAEDSSSSTIAFPEITDSSTSDTSEELNVDTNEARTDDTLTPEAYIEDDSKRRIELTERELNALLAKNTDLAEQLVVDLSGDSASVNLLIDLDPDLPFFGGKTLKVSGGTELSYQNDRPVVIMTGVSVWGVPMPNAWLGGLKNIDLVKEFGGDGFWKGLAEGIEDFRVEDGKLMIQLAE